MKYIIKATCIKIANSHMYFDKEPSHGMLLAIAALGTLTLAIGFMPQPLILFSQTAAAALLEPAAYLSAVPSASIPEARP